MVLIHQRHKTRLSSISISLLFAAETLVHKIREDQEIEGIKIDDSLINICQLADDTSCLLKNYVSLTQCVN